MTLPDSRGITAYRVRRFVSYTHEVKEAFGHRLTRREECLRFCAAQEVATCPRLNGNIPPYMLWFKNISQSLGIDVPATLNTLPLDMGVSASPRLLIDHLTENSNIRKPPCTLSDYRFHALGGHCQPAAGRARGVPSPAR